MTSMSALFLKWVLSISWRNSFLYNNIEGGVILTQYVFKLDGLNCANCALKIERAVSDKKENQKAVLNFTTKTLKFSSEEKNKAKVKDNIQKTVDSIESGITVIAEDDNSEVKADYSVHKVVAGIVLFAVGLLFEFVFDFPNYVLIIPFVLSAIISGYDVFMKGIKAVFKLKLDENTLMAVAVIAAFFSGEYFEACLVILLFSIGEIFEDRAVDRSRRDIAALAKIRPDTANLLSNGETVVVPAQQIEVGQHILVKPYERIPNDGVVIDGRSHIDNAALTGESVPVEVAKGAKVMSGAMNSQGALTIEVTKTFENSTASRIIEMVEDAAANKGESEKMITNFARIYTPAVLVAAILLTAIPTILGFGEISQWLSRALVFLVAACPCALVISVPLGMYAGIGAQSKQGVLIKGGKYLEALAKADTFAFDKTGTLTTGKLSVVEVRAEKGYTEEQILALAAAAEKLSSHPAAHAIKEKAGNMKLPELSNHKEQAGLGVSAEYEGQKIVCGNYRILNGEANDKAGIYLTVDGKLAGRIFVDDKLREETPSIMKQLKELGVKKTVMLTGDSKQKAKALAEKVGVTEYRAELLPQDKVNHMKAVKEESKSAIYVGDGINDAPVLAMSDCGIAMGLGSEAAIEAADAVLTSGNLKALPKAVKLARKTIKIAYFNISFALAFKAVVLVLAAFGYAPMWLAVVGDTGVALLCILNAVRVLKVKN